MSELRDIYGEMILKKGTILYHSSESIFKQRQEKPMLFLTFHPSEYIKQTKYITRILLNKDISVLFMVLPYIMHDVNIRSALGRLTKQPGGRHRYRKNDTNLEFYKSYLEKDNFDGWFSSINEDFETEIALINNPDAFSVLSCEELIWDWHRPHTTGDSLMKWGTVYKISILPIYLNIHTKYKEMLEKYMTFIDNDIFGIAFLVVLKNAIITYNNGRNTMTYTPDNIIWRFE